MPKHNATGRSRDGKHIRLYRTLTRSEAWRALDCVARCAYLEFADRYSGSNNGRIPMSIRELTAALGVGNDTACRAVRDLEHNGLIACIYRGGFTQKTGPRRASEWRLTDFACDATGGPATREFLTKKINNTVRPQEPDGSAPGTGRFGSRNRGAAERYENTSFGSATGTANGSHGSATGTLLVNQGTAGRPPPSQQSNASEKNSADEQSCSTERQAKRDSQFRQRFPKIVSDRS